MEFTVEVPSTEVTGEISDYELENALDGALGNFDFVNSDGVISVVDDLLDEFRVNGGCATNQRFQKAVQLVIEANLAGESEHAPLLHDNIREIVKEELHRVLRGKIAEELGFYRLTRSNS